MSYCSETMQIANTTSNNLYNQDYYQWLLITAELLRAEKLAEVELENLTEEIEDLGRSQQTALKGQPE